MNKMCQKRNSVTCLILRQGTTKRIRVDKCLRPLIISLSFHDYETVGCCCGHGRYPMTVVCKAYNQDRYYDLISGIDIPRTKRFYKKDKDGFYYIPEVVNSI